MLLVTLKEDAGPTKLGHARGLSGVSLQQRPDGKMLVVDQFGRRSEYELWNQLSQCQDVLYVESVR